MKAKKINKKFTKEEQAEMLVYRSNPTPEAREASMNALREARKNIKQGLTEGQVLYAKVKQLQFSIEEYINSNQYNEDVNFAFFLRKYIKLGYRRNKDFAQDIELPATQLSSILNNGRQPSEKTIVRLELHSNNAIPAVSWYRLWEKDNAHKLQTDEKIRERENKHVKNRLEFQF